MLTRNYLKLKQFISLGHSVLVLGPRGCGKTHYLSRVIYALSNSISIDLLKASEYERYLRNSQLLEKEIQARLEINGTLSVFIDEIQRLPNLLNEVHRLIELYKPNIQFILTGSSARKLKDENANLLAGRALRIDFFPLDINEVELDKDLSQVLQFGCLPQVFTESNIDLRTAFLKTYVGTYLQEEIQQEARLKDMESFARFLELSALENASNVNFLKMAKALGISDLTAKSYYQLLVDTLIAYEIPAWHYSIRKQIHKSSKYYLFDNGVINALTGEINSELRSANYRYGKLFENFVVTQLIQALSKEDSPLKLYHYREYSGREVDLIAQKNAHSPPIAIEIKSQTSPTASDVKSLIAFMKEYKNSKGMVICQTPRLYVDKGIVFAPVKEAFKQIIEFGNISIDVSAYPT